MKDFSLGRKIGRGRFGNVYMAEEKDTGSIFAIKMVSIQQVKDEEMIGQLVEEIKLQIYLQHPNVLKMYGFFVETGNVCMILEYANEKCLFRKLRSKVLTLSFSFPKPTLPTIRGKCSTR